MLLCVDVDDDGDNDAPDGDHSLVTGAAAGLWGTNGTGDVIGDSFVGCLSLVDSASGSKYIASGGSRENSTYREVRRRVVPSSCRTV